MGMPQVSVLFMRRQLVLFLATSLHRPIFELPALRCHTCLELVEQGGPGTFL